MRHAWIALLLTLVSTALVSADNRNAATWYERAIDSMDRRLTEADREYLGDHAASNEHMPEPTPELRSIVTKSSSALQHARRGSREAWCDFGLDYGQGLDLTLPHLRPMRVLEQLMRADAIIRLADGDRSGAAESLAAGYRMAGHLRDDRTLISALVGTAMFRHADAGLQYAVDHAALAGDDSATLLDAVLTLDPRDPFGIVDAVAMEQEIVVGWLDHRFDEDGGVGIIEDVAGWNDLGPDLAAQLEGVTEEEFDAEVGRYDAVMDRVAAAFAIDDPDASLAALDEIHAEIEAGDHGLLAQIMSWNHEGVHARLVETRAVLDARTRLLAELAAGDVAPAEKANAVTYYLRAIAMLHERDDLDLLRRFDGAPAPEITPELTSLLEACGPIVDVVREGSLRQRCDFAFARFRAQPTVAQAYAPGLRDLFRLLHADARRLLSVGDTAAAIDRLATAYRLVAHAALDGTLVTSMVADEGLRRTQPIVEMLPPEAKPDLQVAFKRIGRADPFGYIAALHWQRETLGGGVFGVQAGHVDADRRAEIAEAVGVWKAAEVLALTACVETHVRADRATSPRPPEVSLQPLGDLLSVAALDRTVELTPLVVQRLRAPSLITLVPDLVRQHEVTLPAIADVERRMREARSVLRDAARGRR